jgi:hypothetical protein
MSTKQFVTFEKFNDQYMALELANLLRENHIEFEQENIPLQLDTTFGNNELNKEFKIKLKKEDFEKVDSLLQEISRKQIENVDSSYYLFDFTDKELLEIITKRDEWGSFDYVLAQKILKDRGKEITQEVVDLLKENRIKELAKPAENQTAWITSGYVFAILGGLLGFFISWHLINHKKTLPNGDIVYGFSEKDRKHGKIIFILSIIFIIPAIYLRYLALMR